MPKTVAVRLGEVKDITEHGVIKAENIRQHVGIGIYLPRIHQVILGHVQAPSTNARYARVLNALESTKKQGLQSWVTGAAGRPDSFRKEFLSHLNRIGVHPEEMWNGVGQVALMTFNLGVHNGFQPHIRHK